jgi:RNA polymerase sigma factor (sigma-70 family)
MTTNDDLGHLFRHQSGRLVPALVRLFGLKNLDLAEDVAQETLLRAVEVWKFHGVPDDPAAWLIKSAKNRAIDVLRKQKTARTFAAEVATEWSLVPTVEQTFNAIRDEELRMMFTCCHPRIPEEARIALVLSTLCGFGAREIAAAFMVSTSAIEKRLVRAKQTLAETPSLFSFDDIAERTPAVLRALYVLFSEGYHGSDPQEPVREDLCNEAMRLCAMLREHASTPETDALLALMSLHAARLPARVRDGALVPWEQQDRAKWDHELVRQGLRLLEEAARGTDLSAYHLEAAIAAEHALAPSREAIAWPKIVELYRLLMRVSPSPAAALSHAIAVGEASGAEAGLRALESIDDERLSGAPFLDAARGDLLMRVGRVDEARAAYRAAIGKARSDGERRFLEAKMH